MLRMIGMIRVYGLAAVVLFGLVGLALATPGMGVSPAGVENQPNTGHHHLLVDATLEGDALKFPIPNDEHHLHFGKGQTETVLTLPPGRHTLQLVLGDWQHLPHEPPVMSERIIVQEARAAPNMSWRWVGPARRR